MPKKKAIRFEVYRDIRGYYLWRAGYPNGFVAAESRSGVQRRPQCIASLIKLQMGICAGQREIFIINQAGEATQFTPL